MKKKAIIISLILILIFALSSCEDFNISLGGSQSPENTETPQEPQNPNEPENPQEPETPEVEYCTISFFDGSNKITEIKVEKGKVVSSETLLYMSEIGYKGYTYEGWYTNQLTTRAFNSDLPISRDVNLYGKKGNLAGKNVRWYYDDANHTLSFEGLGEMFAYETMEGPSWRIYADVVENIVIADGITTVANCAFTKFKSKTCGV